MGKTAFQTFTGNGSIVIPAGVTQVTVVSKAPQVGLVPSGPGGTSTFVIDIFGNLWGWGVNGSGTIGDATTTNRSSPVLVAGGRSWLSIATPLRDNFPGTAAIDSKGAAYCWGDNTYGQLGDGTNTSNNSPVPVVGGISFISIANYCGGTGTPFTAGIATNGNLYTWGSNDSGQLGDGTTVGKSSPVAVIGGLKFVSFVSYNNTARGITTTGAMYAWGQNTNGVLGIGNTTGTSSPQQVLGGLSFAKLPIYSGVTNNPTSLGITTSGDLYAWGLGTSGQLGDGTSVSKSSPVLVVGGKKWQNVYSVHTSTWGITTDGDLYAWGQNGSGQLGDGTTTSRSSPTLVLGGLKWQSVYPIGPAGAAGHSIIGLATTGAMYGWGDNTDGQVGDNTVTNRSSPVAVVGGLSFVAGAMTGTTADFTAYGVQANGQIYAWGYNGQGQLGDGNTVVQKRSSPVKVLGSVIANTNPLITTTVIPVVPGTTYSLNIQQPNPTFGSTVIGTLPASSTTVYFGE